MLINIGILVCRSVRFLLGLVDAIIAVVPESGELFLRDPDVVEGLAVGVLLVLDVGAGELDVPDARIFALVEDLDVVDPEGFVQADGDRSDAVVATLRCLVALVQPELAVGDDQAVSEELALLNGALHGILAL